MDETIDEEDSLHPLVRRSDERPERHRTWLLWLAQDPDRRSWRLVARAIGRDESTVRSWRRKHGWEERTKMAGHGAQAMALATYRADYLPRHGRLELEAIRGNCSLSLAPGDPVKVPQPESVQEGRSDPATGKRKPGNVQGRSASRKKTDDELAVRKGVLLIDAGLAQFAKDVAAGNIKVRPRDVPYLLACRRQLGKDLAEIEAGGAGELTQGNAVIPESFRVKSARSSGGDVIDALRQDAEDLSILLRAISNNREEEANEQEVLNINEAAKSAS